MIEELLLNSVMPAFFGLIGGMTGAYIMHKKLDAEVLGDIYGLKASFERHATAELSQRGTAASQVSKERTEAALGEAVAALQAGTTWQEVLKAVGAKYPDVAMRLVKQGMKL